MRAIKARPVDLLDADKAAMLPMPPIAPMTGWINRVRLGRDYYVRVDSSDYSVYPAVIGRFVDVHADLARVEVRRESRLVARHDRVWARGMTITDPAHIAAAKVLRASSTSDHGRHPTHTRAHRQMNAMKTGASFRGTLLVKAGKSWWKEAWFQCCMLGWT